MSTELQGYGAESPENKVSVLQTQADEVLAFAVFSRFMELNLFCKQRKMLLTEYCEPLTANMMQFIQFAPNSTCVGGTKNLSS